MPAQGKALPDEHDDGSQALVTPACVGGSFTSLIISYQPLALFISFAGFLPF
jgi:hypothetical protein